MAFIDDMINKVNVSKRIGNQKGMLSLIFSAIILVIAIYFVWGIFLRPTIDYRNWEKSFDNRVWYAVRVPYYSYDTILPDLYFRTNAFMPDSLVDSKLYIKFSGCILEVFVNDKLAYSNPTCTAKVQYDEQIINLKGLVNTGQNKFRFHFLEDGGTLRFELAGGKENNLLRYIALIFLLSVFVYAITRRVDFIFIILLWSIIFLHLFPNFFPYSWGFEALNFYPLSIKAFVVILGLMVSIPYPYRKIESFFIKGYAISYNIVKTLTRKFNNKLMSLKESYPIIYAEFSDMRMYLTYVLIGIVSFFIFWYLRTKHSLGDQGFVGQIALNKAYTFFHTSPLSAWFLTYAYSILQSLGVKYSSYMISSIVSCFYGAIAIPVLWATCKELVEDRWKSLAIFSIVSTSYFMVLFFGYIEFYPALLFWMILYVYTPILYLKDKVGIFIPSLFFALMFLTHLSSGFIAPSLLLLLLLKMYQRRGVGISREFLIMSLSVIIPAALILGHVIFVFNGCNGTFSNCITDFWNALKGSDPSFVRPDLLTSHFAEDIVNEYLLVSPAAVILLFFLIIKWREINFRDEKLIFIASVSFLFGIYTFIHFTGLGFPQDWDVLAPIGFPLTLLGSYVLVNVFKDNATLRFYVVSIIFVSVFVHTLPTLLHDADLMDLLINPLIIMNVSSSWLDGLVRVLLAFFNGEESYSLFISYLTTFIFIS